MVTVWFCFVFKKNCPKMFSNHVMNMAGSQIQDVNKQEALFFILLLVF